MAYGTSSTIALSGGAFTGGSLAFGDARVCSLAVVAVALLVGGLVLIRLAAVRRQRHDGVDRSFDRLAGPV
jgi:hypothetical protein